MSWYPRDLVKEAVDVFLDFYTGGGLEDITWGKKVELGMPIGTKTANHDAQMIYKASRLHDDHPMLPQISKILSNLPVEQYNAILALYHYVGLNTEAADQKWKDGRAYTDADRAKKVGQSESDFRRNYGIARVEIYNRLTNTGGSSNGNNRSGQREHIRGGGANSGKARPAIDGGKDTRIERGAGNDSGGQPIQKRAG